MSAQPVFRLVGGIDFSIARNEKQSLAAARARARPVLREWLGHVAKLLSTGQLTPVDALLAKELTNYPSANEGRCYAGQERLGAAIGRCARSARRSLKRLCQAGLLDSKRGGPGRTTSWTLCINGQAVFNNAAARANRTLSVPDRTNMSGLDRTKVSDKPLEEDPLERKPSPYPPNAQAAPLEGCRTEKPGKGSPEEDIDRDGEILRPTGELTFEALWAACDGDQGLQGPALSAWRRLSLEDRRAIAARIKRDCTINLNGCWLATWLRTRAWSRPALQRRNERDAWRRAADQLRRAVDAQEHDLRALQRDTPSWHAYRAEMIARGESTRFFDQCEWWTVDERRAE